MIGEFGYVTLINHNGDEINFSIDIDGDLELTVVVPSYEYGGSAYDDHTMYFDTKNTKKLFEGLAELIELQKTKEEESKNA